MGKNGLINSPQMFGVIWTYGDNVTLWTRKSGRRRRRRRRKYSYMSPSQAKRRYVLKNLVCHVWSALQYLALWATSRN